MPRFSVALDDDENEWVERLADERDRSKSSIVASIVEAAHAEGYDTFVNGESDRTTVNRLDDLEERVAELEARESTRDALAEGRDTADVEESGESGHAVPARGDGRDQPSDAPHGAEEEEESPGVSDPSDGAGERPDLDDVLAEAWSPDSERRDRKREVGRAALEWLRERDRPASGSDFREALGEEYAVDGQNESTWWRMTVRPAVKAATEAGLVEYRSGHHDYRWTGGE